MSMKLYYVQAGHWSVPGNPASLHFVKGEAVAAAAQHVRVLIDDVNALLDGECDPVGTFDLDEEWPTALRDVQRARILWFGSDVDMDDLTDEGFAEASECDVWIEEIEAELTDEARHTLITTLWPFKPDLLDGVTL